jgi:hypothetical protein
MLGDAPLAAVPLAAVPDVFVPVAPPPTPAVAGAPDTALAEHSGVRGGYTVPPQMAGVRGVWQEPSESPSGWSNPAAAQAAEQVKYYARLRRRRREAEVVAVLLLLGDGD